MIVITGFVIYDHLCYALLAFSKARSITGSEAEETA
jgi:hypothetical protein